MAELPPSAIDNNPIIEPLAILASKMDNTAASPTRLVLVQWLGLPPEDASWEKWTDLASTYHLEDKVTFQEEGIDNNTVRPKRVLSKPNYLDDYILLFESNDAQEYS